MGTTVLRDRCVRGDLHGRSGALVSPWNGRTEVPVCALPPGGKRCERLAPECNVSALTAGDAAGTSADRGRLPRGPVVGSAGDRGHITCGPFAVTADHRGRDAVRGVPFAPTHRGGDADRGVLSSPTDRRRLILRRIRSSATDGRPLATCHVRPFATHRRDAARSEVAFTAAGVLVGRHGPSWMGTSHAWVRHGDDGAVCGVRMGDYDGAMRISWCGTSSTYQRGLVCYTWSQPTSQPPPYPGYRAVDSLLRDVTESADRGVGALLAGREFAELGDAAPELVVVTDAGFRVLDVSGVLPPALTRAEEDQRTIATLPEVGGTVAVQDGLAYVAGTNFYGPARLHVVDVSQPLPPTIVSRSDMPIGAWFHGSIIAQGERAYVVRNDQQLVVYDIGDPANPRELGSTFVTDRSPIFLVGDAVLVHRDVVDVSDGNHPRAVKESARKWPVIATGTLKWTVIDARAYAPSEDSVLVLDVSNPYDMTLLGRVPMGARIDGVYRDGGLIVVTYADSEETSLLRPTADDGA